MEEPARAADAGTAPKLPAAPDALLGLGSSGLTLTSQSPARVSGGSAGYQPQVHASGLPSYKLRLLGVSQVSEMHSPESAPTSSAEQGKDGGGDQPEGLLEDENGEGLRPTVRRRPRVWKGRDGEGIGMAKASPVSAPGVKRRKCLWGEVPPRDGEGIGNREEESGGGEVGGEDASEVDHDGDKDEGIPSASASEASAAQLPRMMSAAGPAGVPLVLVAEPQASTSLTHPPVSRGDGGTRSVVVQSSGGSSAAMQVPASVNRHLRDYQRDGVRFLHRQFSQGKGGILADDMGLGKTVQSIGTVAYHDIPDLSILKPDAYLTTSEAPPTPTPSQPTLHTPADRSLHLGITGEERRCPGLGSHHPKRRILRYPLKRPCPGCLSDVNCWELAAGVLLLGFLQSPETAGQGRGETPTIYRDTMLLCTSCPYPFFGC